eukprot:TRINITY_DN3325_c0_g1_i2.p1 TRINITY_DN3325_c0_g1~~TRINITY_DN3325_c0_g1_i2.p1  ORF type:complete len:352 (-),score=116.11 TRINITY_DN3325_c0_g1_i2:93-1148(-)
MISDKGTPGNQRDPNDSYSEVRDNVSGKASSKSSFEEHAMTEEGDQTLKFNLTNTSFSIREEEFSVQDYPMLRQLCDPSKYKKSDNCYVCKKEFGLLTKKKKACKFCGNSVCESCSPKKRANPQNKEDFQRICDRCEMIYLKKMLYDEYNAKKVEREKKLEKKLADLSEMQSLLKKMNTDLELLRSENSKQNQELEEGTRRMREKTAKIRVEIEKLEKENVKQGETIKEYQERIQETKRKIEDKERLLDERKQKLAELNKQIQARTDDISNIKREITELEARIEVMNNSLISNDPGSSLLQGPTQGGPNGGTTGATQPTTQIKPNQPPRNINNPPNQPAGGTQSCNVCHLF